MKEKRTGLGEVPLRKSKIEETRKVIKTIAGGGEKPKLGTSEVMKLRTSELQKITVPLKDEQVETLTRICKTIMRKRVRGEKRERITNNSIIRACLDIILPALSLANESLENVKSEEELTERIKQLLKSGSSKLEK